MADERGKNTTVTGNTANGDIAGGNITKTTNVLQERPGSLMRSLIQRLEKDQSQETVEMLAKLQHYLASVDPADAPLQGLVGKLTAAKRVDSIHRATTLKEIVAKRFTQSALSDAAQRIYVHVLGQIFRLFKCEVAPLVAIGAPDADVDRALHEKLIQPLLVELEDNPLFVDGDDIEGFVYFLTGNCHIKWT